MIKFIAAVCMLIDHIGFMFFPEYLIFRIVGRLAMPLFAFCMARAFSSGMEFDKSFKYFVRLFIFAVVSQIPYHFFIPGSLNVGFTWLIGFMLLFVVVKFFDMPVFYASFFAVVAVFCLVFTIVFPVDYGLYGVLYPLVLYFGFFKLNKYKLLGALVGSCLILLVYFYHRSGHPLQLFALFSVFVIGVVYRFDCDRLINLKKWVYYVFYPVHISLLVVFNAALK